MSSPPSVRASGAWYLSALAIGVVLERYVNYLWYEETVIFGQPANVFTAYVYFAVTFVLWLALRNRPKVRGPALTFLSSMAIAWLAHFFLYRFHGDSFNYTALLYLPILLFLALKPPSLSEVRIASLSFAWTVAMVLVVTRVLEVLGVLAIRSQMQGVIEFDTERYFLPLNEVMGIDGRWPGPFGHNGDTAMMGALLIVLALAFWARASWILVIVGGLTLLLTNGRASIGAAAAGVVLMTMFGRSPWLNQVPRRVRISAGSLLLLLGALAMFARPAGLTGRDNIWPAFLQLWLESPVVGVGGSGIANGNEIAQAFGHAHSLYIDELARWGLIGFISQFTAIGLGVFIAARAAGIGYPGPLAVTVTYLITGITEPRNNWIAPSATGFLLILMVLGAAAYLDAQRAARADSSEPDLSDHYSFTRTTGAEARSGDEESGSVG